MNKKPLIKKSSFFTKFKSWKSRLGSNEPKFTIIDKQPYYDKNKNTFYVKVVTICGFLCRDVPVDEILLSNNSILKSLDQKSLCFVYYLAGRLEDLANKEHNSLFTFHGINPNNPSIFLVKSLMDMSIHEWEIHEAYVNNLYYNLDKPSIARFIERYLIVRQINITQKENNHLWLVK